MKKILELLFEKEISKFIIIYEDEIEEKLNVHIHGYKAHESIGLVQIEGHRFINYVLDKKIMKNEIRND